MNEPYEPIFAKEGYELITPERICALTLDGIARQLSPQQRAFLTMVLRGYDQPSATHWSAAQEHLMRIGYRPASEEPVKTARRIRRGRGSY